MKSNVKFCLKLVGIFVCLIVVYLISMMLSFALPSDGVNAHYEQAKVIIESEGLYPNSFYRSDGSIMDNATDNSMLTTSLKYDDMSLRFNALYNRGYARYWHGYVVFLRPLLMFVDYLAIRKIVSAVHMILFILALFTIHKRFGYRATIPFGVTWFAFFSATATTSLQYFSSYVVMFIGTILVCRFYKEQKSWKFLSCLFMVIGSVINFLDLLTFPLITLAVPLIFVILVDILERKKTMLQMIANIAVSSIVWAVSYALTWVLKWVLCAVILKSGVISNALKQAEYRMVGDENFVIDRVKVLTANIEGPMLLKTFLNSLVPWILLVVIIILQRRWKECFRFLPLICIGIMPYVWYEVLVNHSQQHRFFTYRAQMGTLLIILLMFFYAMFPIKIKDVVSWVKNKMMKNKKKKD
ncbi:MAG: hypothetical protein IJ423_05080 [Clostridia bacterium]|nr:hypothetical protein [Clostridia bacterium]